MVSGWIDRRAIVKKNEKAPKRAPVREVGPKHLGRVTGAKVTTQLKPPAALGSRTLS
jgi:hypothetical protein